MTARIYAYHSDAAVLRFWLFICLSVGCPLGEGQILFNFLLAMIPIIIPPDVETLHLTTNGGTRKDVLSVMCGTLIGLPENMMFSPFPFDVFLSFALFALVATLTNKRSQSDALVCMLPLWQAGAPVWGEATGLVALA